MADLRIDVDKLANELFEPTELGDFTFGFKHGCGIGQGFCDSLACHLIGQAEVGAVGCLFGLMAAAVGLATAARGRRDGTAAKVVELNDLFDDLDTLLFEGFQGTWHHHMSLLLA